MKPYTANLLAGIVLIIMSAWAYLTSETPSITALIPGFFGVVFLALTNPLKNENKVVAHIIVVLTFILLISLYKPLSGVLAREDTMGIIRVLIMILVCLLALTSYIQSFIKARKSRAS